MPPPEFKCTICGNMVSKRKSLVWGDGRACRTHDQVVNSIKKEHERLSQTKISDEAMRNLNLISAVSFIRSMHTIRGVPVSVLLDHVRARFRDEKLMEKIEKELKERGDTMTSEEITSSLFSYGSLMKSVQDNKIS